MLSKSYEISDMEQLHEHVLEYQNNLLDAIETLRNSVNNPEAHHVLDKLQIEVEELPYKKLSIFYAEE